MSKRRDNKRIPRHLNNGRDRLVVALIMGATKAAVHKDHRKEQSRKACRGRVYAE